MINFSKYFIMKTLDNVHVREITRLISPNELKAKTPSLEAHAATVLKGRQAIQQIITREDTRLLVVIGPCSIHDPKGALEYAERLVELRQKYADRMEIIMRVYFQKPRTTIGWKGLINDPHLNGSYDIETGLYTARKTMLDIVGMGLPAAIEFLDPVIPQYLSDLVSWCAIGARTTESQTHREMASGLSMPVGFKNGTDGSPQNAINAMKSAITPHSFLGIDQEGHTSVIHSKGNAWSHLVLRGGHDTTNYDATSIQETLHMLKLADLTPILMVDCSHANSNKQHRRQEDVWNTLLEQRHMHHEGLMGVMVESYLEEGNQPILEKSEDLRYGVSITDACVGWETTERMLRTGYEKLKK